MNNDLRWMTVKEAMLEIGPGELCWYAIDEGMDLIELGGWQNYWVIGCGYPIDFTPSVCERARICRALAPQSPTNVGEQ